jgi:hypothetical protein
MDEIDLIDWDDLGYKENCRFSGVTVGPNEAVRIEVDPAKTNVNGIIYVKFISSSIHSIPREVFTKFPNLKTLQASGQNIQEITADTFSDAGKLRVINLADNAITFLHKDTFKGQYFIFAFVLISNIHTNLIKFQFTGSTKLHNNKIRALQPQMFSHLADLNDLWLQNNTCVDKKFPVKPSKATIERGLAACGAAYEIQEQLEVSATQSFEKIDEKLKLLKKLFDQNQELQELYNAKFEERLEENTKEIRSIKNML